MSSPFDALEQLVAEDPRERGIANLVQWGSLEAAARSLTSGRKAGVVSGFYLPVPQVGETDGPPGAKAIGEALRAIGVEPVYITDTPNAPLFEAMGLTVTLYTPELDGKPEFTHLVSTERPGRAADGRYYSMSARDLSEFTAPIDSMFLEAPARGIATIAIGDGGNEIGMGNVAGQVRRDVPHGDRIASVVPADWLIVAGISNFGAYGLVTALSLLAGRNLLPSDAQATEEIHACVAAGACCGHTFRNEPLVDGTPLETTLEVLRRMREILAR